MNTGQTWLTDEELYYYKARVYNPRLGRFMQIDPIGYADVLNWYIYVGNDLINNVDPSGLYKREKLKKLERARLYLELDKRSSSYINRGPAPFRVGVLIGTVISLAAIVYQLSTKEDRKESLSFAGMDTNAFIAGGKTPAGMARNSAELSAFISSEAGIIGVVPFEGVVQHFQNTPSFSFQRGLKRANAEVLGSAMSGGVTATLTRDRELHKKFPEWVESY